MRISDWSSDVCSSDLKDGLIQAIFQRRLPFIENRRRLQIDEARKEGFTLYNLNEALFRPIVEEVDENGHRVYVRFLAQIVCDNRTAHHWLKASSMVPSIIEIMTEQARSEEHTSELQSLMRSSYAVFCLKKKKT